jgi:hypothetical protein
MLVFSYILLFSNALTVISILVMLLLMFIHAGIGGKLFSGFIGILMGFLLLTIYNNIIDIGRCRDALMPQN